MHYKQKCQQVETTKGGCERIPLYKPKCNKVPKQSCKTSYQKRCRTDYKEVKRLVNTNKCVWPTPKPNKECP